MEQYISQVITQEEIESIQAGYFNILRAPRGWGKTTFMFDDRILNFSRGKKNVLYLIHNKLSRDRIVEENSDKAVVFDNADNISSWFDHRANNAFCEGEDEDKVHVMCYQTFAALIRKRGTDWLNEIDLIIWDEFDDIRGYYKKEISTLKKALPNFSEERLASLLQEGRTNSMVNFVYQIKTVVLDPGKIILLAISATPERASMLFRDYINYILKGQLEEKFYALETHYVNNICGAIIDGTLCKGRKYWCYVHSITDGFRIANVGEGHGFNTLLLWSDSNEEWRKYMTPERKEMLQRVRDEQDLPDEYDFVIITAVGGRSVNFYDTSFQDWICGDTDYEAIGQYMRARFTPAREYLLESVRGLVDFVRNGFSCEYYEWHTLSELRELVKEKPVFTKGDRKKQLLTFNAVKKEYPDLFEARIYGKSRLTQYRIKQDKPAE